MSSRTYEFSGNTSRHFFFTDTDEGVLVTVLPKGRRWFRAPKARIQIVHGGVRVFFQ